jgi:hypothetical protein
MDEKPSATELPGQKHGLNWSISPSPHDTVTLEYDEFRDNPHFRERPRSQHAFDPSPLPPLGERMQPPCYASVG